MSQLVMPFVPCFIQLHYSDHKNVKTSQSVKS